MTSWSIFTLGGGAVVWRSIKQSSIADSTMEVEYIAACEAAKESVWLKKFYIDLEVVLNMENHLFYTVTTVERRQTPKNQGVTREGSI